MLRLQFVSQTCLNQHSKQKGTLKADNGNKKGGFEVKLCKQYISEGHRRHSEVRHKIVQFPTMNNKWKSRALNLYSSHPINRGAEVSEPSQIREEGGHNYFVTSSDSWGGGSHEIACHCAPNFTSLLHPIFLFFQGKTVELTDVILQIMSKKSFLLLISAKFK